MLSDLDLHDCVYALRDLTDTVSKGYVGAIVDVYVEEDGQKSFLAEFGNGNLIEVFTGDVALYTNDISDIEMDEHGYLIMLNPPE